MDQPTTPIAPESSPHNGSSNSTVLGVLSYLGILVIIPFFMAKDDQFVKFHVRQGIVLLVIEILLSVLSGAFRFNLGLVISIVQLATFVLSVIGIINVVQRKEKELPLVGSFAKYITI